MSRENDPSGGVAEDAVKAAPVPSESAEQQAEHLQAEAEAARDELEDLVGELDRRRHRAAKPIVAGVIALAVVGIGSYVLWRIFRSRPAPKLKRFGKALHLSAARANVAQDQPSVAKKIFTAAAVGMASAAGRRALMRHPESGK
jgi:hypothetical protein